MPFSPDVILLIFGVQLLAFTVKCLLGFGNPLISAPLLSLRLDNLLITPGTLLLDTTVNTYITLQNRHHFQWRKIVPLLAANILGVIPGTWLLRFSMPWVIKTILGVVVVFLGLEMATRSIRPARKRADPVWVRYVVAVFSGVCAGLFGINMFLTAYLQRSATDYQEFKGSICFLFLGENVFRLCLYIASGMITTPILLFALISAPGLLLAILLSRKLAPHISERALFPAAIAMFILGGISIILKSIA